MTSNRKFTEDNDIRFPLVSDKDRVVKKQYGRGRVTYLIDKNGIIRFIQKGVPNNKDFLNAIKGLN